MSSNNNEKSALKEFVGRYKTSAPPPQDNTLDRYNRQLDMQNNNAMETSTAAGGGGGGGGGGYECRLFINPNVYSDYAIGRYIDDTSQTRTVSSATSTAALGQDSWTWRSVSPFSHSDLVRSVSNGGPPGSVGCEGVLECDNWSVDRPAWQHQNYPQQQQSSPCPGKFKLLRAKFMRNRRNKLNRLSNKIAETTAGSAYIRAENGFKQPPLDKLNMQAQTAAALLATAIVAPPKVKPKVSKVAKGPSRGGAGSGGGRSVGDINDPMMRRPRRRVSEQKKKADEELYAQLFSPEKYEQTWYL